MNDYIDNYCERLEPGPWAEPLNALTNLAFFAAAFFAYVLVRKERTLDWRSGLLIALVVVIGMGSTLFHTFATFWAMLADSIPILFYQIAFIALYAGNVIRCGCVRSSVLIALFLLVQYAAAQAPHEWLNGSVEYAPAWLFLFGLSLWHIKGAAREHYGLLAAVAVFTISLSVRSSDMALCTVIPFGIHFLWHLLNGALLYLTTRAYILNAKTANAS